jgi:hypothetical protein
MTIVIQGFALRTVRALRKLAQIFQPPYRPERYYMRGPGPMWHAKHELASVGVVKRTDRSPC